jgi:hypothetical protein
MPDSQVDHNDMALAFDQLRSVSASPCLADSTWLIPSSSIKTTLPLLKAHHSLIIMKSWKAHRLRQKSVLQAVSAIAPKSSHLRYKDFQ